MLEFRPIRLEDRAVIEQYTLPSSVTNCDMAFANMYCWQAIYHSAWAVVEGFLVIRFHIGGSTKIGYMQPVGDGDFSSIIPLLSQDAHAHGQRLRIIGLSLESSEVLRNGHPGLFAFASDRALEDYIYLADDLRELQGRGYQPKRNHINRFMAACPDYRYEPLTPDRFEECMALERAWRRAHEGHTSELCAEQRAMQLAFDNFDELGMRGGCIYSADQLVAFTYGSAVNAHTFVIHAEKAGMQFDGAFTMINKLFAEQLPAEFTHINREEDMGLDGLRRAKLSYHPVAMGHKFTAIRLHSDERACKKLWQKVFGDDDVFTDSFIISRYHERQMIARHIDGELVAMLHLIPMQSSLGRTTYIYGVATHPDFRRRGLADSLMCEAMQRIEAQGDDAAALIPSQEWLREYYSRYGFVGQIPTTFISPGGFDFGTGETDRDLAMVWQRKAHQELPDAISFSIIE